VDVETAIGLWQEGERRLRFAEPEERLVMERVADRIVDALHRRLGGSFTTDELAALYSAGGTDWCLDVALAASPDDSRGWDAQTIGNAAFARYVREASDWAGGRRRVPDKDEEAAEQPY
jgi:hypothetical protein